MLTDLKKIKAEPAAATTIEEIHKTLRRWILPYQEQLSNHLQMENLC
jgi:hypothetical protein